MRALRVLAVLTLGVAAGAQAQLAVQQPTEKLLVLPLSAAPAESAASIATMDAARARLVQLARYKALVVTKAKICEALQQSGFPCDGLMTDVQASQLARALGINNYTTGSIERAGGQYVARVHIVSGASGFAATFSLSGATTAALGESIAQRMFNIIKAAENARSCNDQRSRNSLERALGEAAKALQIEPDLAAAHLCVATIREVQHAPVDSIIAASRRALRGDSSNTTAWSSIASKLLVKGDTSGAILAFRSMLSFNPTDKTLRLALAQQMLQHKAFASADSLLSEGLKFIPGDQQFRDLRKRACIEGGLYRCTLDILKDEVTADTTKLADTSQLKLALANAQAIPDTQAMLWWARAAVAHFPTSVSFLKQLSQAFQTAGQADSSVVYYKKVLAINPGDVATSLLVGKAIVDVAVWDTVAARRLQDAKDTVGLRRLREPFAAQVDAAKPYLAPGLTSSDSSIRLFTINVAYTAGTKLAQAGALDRVYNWLEVPFQQLENDTAAGHQPLRSTIGYLYGLASTYTMGPLLTDIQKSKKCDKAPAVYQRIQRSKSALNLGARVAPAQVRQPLSMIAQFENFMTQVKRAYKCTNF